MELRETRENYRVVDIPNSQSLRCVVYFSSNALYSPNTEEGLRRAIKERDRYEWTRNLFPDAGRHIFVRDIYKQWYLGGISDENDSIEKVLELLRTLTRDYTSIVCVGSSAGGYAAVLFGCLLRAERVLAFNPQFSLSFLIREPTASRVNPVLWGNRDNGKVSVYFEIGELLRESQVPIYYFLSAHSEKDVSQYTKVQGCTNLKTIFFRTANHGIPFLRPVFRPLFTMTEPLLDRLVGRSFHPLLFSFAYAGVFPCLKFLCHKLFRWKELYSVFVQWRTKGKIGI